MNTYTTAKLTTIVKMVYWGRSSMLVTFVIDWRGTSLIIHLSFHIIVVAVIKMELKLETNFQSFYLLIVCLIGIYCNSF